VTGSGAPRAGAQQPAPLEAGCPEPPAHRFDVALLDLDGVVYVGPEAVPGVPDSLTRARTAGMRLGFVTNNASRTPEEVAAHLGELGVPASAEDVITSSQAAAAVVRSLHGAGAAVLPVGGPGVAAALAAEGLAVVHRAEDRPAAVVQGYGREVGWAELAEAVVAVRGGAEHVATNADATIPSPRGPLPGNGALVGVVAAVTGRAPRITGKPDPAMHAECVRRTGAVRPLVVGDRLDTDIEGARRAGAASLLVLTGVTDPAALLAAGPQERPDLLAADTGGLLRAHPPVTADGPGWRCGGWTVHARDGAVVLTAAGQPADTDELDGLRALCVAAWSAADRSGRPVRVEGGDERGAAAVAGWRLAAR
jgi:HAD superfamily hydrolase (TIGR01450 family)